MVKGSVEGGRLHVSVGGKTKTYRIETSAYIGPLGKAPEETGTDTTAAPTDPEPSVKLAVRPERSNGSTGRSPQPDQPPTQAATAKVMISSEPTGADIYVDENFMGNTPPLIELPAGSHGSDRGKRAAIVESRDHVEHWQPRSHCRRCSACIRDWSLIDQDRRVMPVNVKIEYREAVAIVEQGIRAEEKQGSLLKYDKDGNVAAKFTLSDVRHWWTGSAQKSDDF